MALHSPVDLFLLEKHEWHHLGLMNTTGLAVVPSNIKMPAELLKQFIF